VGKCIWRCRFISAGCLCGWVVISLCCFLRL
jgi:hypothetical protein